MKKRLLSLILVMLLLAPSVISCSENAAEDTTETEASAETAADPAAVETVEETEERLLPDIPEKADFGGEEICYVWWNISSWGAGHPCLSSGYRYHSCPAESIRHQYRQQYLCQRCSSGIADPRYQRCS